MSDVPAPTVTAVIVAYGAEPYLEDAVRAVLASTGVRPDVVVVDNGCTGDAVQRVKDHDGVRVITPAGNTGFTGGCRLGAADATTDVVVFVNSDAIVAPTALGRLAEVVCEPAVGAAMGGIRLADSPELMNSAGNPIHYLGLVWAGAFGEPAGSHAERRTVPCMSGATFAIRTALWRELDGFPLEYFAYHEDTELSLRLWQRGRTVEFVPDAVVLHHYEFARNPRKNYLLERNRLALVLTTYQGRTLAVLAPMLILAEGALVAASILGGWAGPKLRGYGWLWRNRAWVRARRAQLQRERTVDDAALAWLYAGKIDPANTEAPPGTSIFNAIAGPYWRMARRLL
ncbi:MAG TPA: glycosyltransferase family 2 protein [Micromonosporaceae bacterium]|nr:glycosyltransferase family 2 protein [Micromonosporaceae bacterium]